MKTTILATVLVVLLAGAAPATPSSANPCYLSSTDTAYLDFLSGQGVPTYGQECQAVQLAHNVVNTLRKSANDLGVYFVLNTLTTSPPTPPLTSHQAHAVLGGAVTYYAPELKPVVEHYADRQTSP